MDERTINCIKWCISIMTGCIVYALGGWDKYIQLLAAMVCVDFILGVSVSIKKKTFSSTVAKWGFVNKILYFVCIALCKSLDEVLGTHLMLRNISITWFLICESSSVLESLVLIGMPMPDGLVDVLIQTKNSFSIRIIDIVKRIVKETLESDTNTDVKKEG